MPVKSKPRSPGPKGGGKPSRAWDELASASPRKGRVQLPSLEDLGAADLAEALRSAEIALGMEPEPEEEIPVHTITEDFPEEEPARRPGILDPRSLGLPIAEADACGEPGKLVAQPPPDLSPYVASLEEELARARERYKSLNRDFERYRGRVREQQESARIDIVIELANKLFPILDNLDRAASHEIRESPDDEGSMRQALEMIHRQFRAALRAMGLEEIPTEGVPFDPTVHEAFEVVSRPDLPENSIVGVILRGFTYKGRLARPSRLRLSTQDAVGRLADATLRPPPREAAPDEIEQGFEGAEEPSEVETEVIGEG